MTTNFNLEQVFELGQLAIYENIEQLPDIEITLEKVLDGYPLIYHLATVNATSGTLVGRSNQKVQVGMAIFDDTLDSASGTPLQFVVVSGAYASALSYTIPVQGNATESLTLLCNNKRWNPAGYTMTGQFPSNNDTPMALAGSSGGVQQRQDIVFGGASDTILPPDVKGISSSGTNNKDAAGDFACHIQNITVSTDLGREPLYELGRRGPYHRYVTFPVEVRTSIEILATDGDLVSATEDGINADGSNLTARTIFIKMKEGTTINLGSQNKLSSVNHNGGATDGGNVSVTYEFLTFNEMTVKHPQDPTSALR